MNKLTPIFVFNLKLANSSTPSLTSWSTWDVWTALLIFMMSYFYFIIALSWSGQVAWLCWVLLLSLSTKCAERCRTRRLVAVSSSFHWMKIILIQIVNSFCDQVLTAADWFYLEVTDEDYSVAVSNSMFRDDRFLGFATILPIKHIGSQSKRSIDAPCWWRNAFNWGGANWTNTLIAGLLHLLKNGFLLTHLCLPHSLHWFIHCFEFRAFQTKPDKT